LVDRPRLRVCDATQRFFPQAESVANSFVDVVTPGEGNDEAVTESRVKWTRWSAEFRFLNAE
jgi:hypothetical protein